jgi:hypothetical protein
MSYKKCNCCKVATIETDKKRLKYICPHCVIYCERIGLKIKNNILTGYGTNNEFIKIFTK